MDRLKRNVFIITAITLGIPVVIVGAYPAWSRHEDRVQLSRLAAAHGWGKLHADTILFNDKYIAVAPTTINNCPISLELANSGHFYVAYRPNARPSNELIDRTNAKAVGLPANDSALLFYANPTRHYASQRALRC